MFSQSELQRLLPGTSLRKIKNAGKHVRTCARKTQDKDWDFPVYIEYAESQRFYGVHVQIHIPPGRTFWNKNLKLSSGERIPIHAVVRTMNASKIVYLYQEEYRNLRLEPLNERTCFRLLKVCRASKQKSFHGLDNMSTAGEEAFETIA